jgi:hypothetical protein
MPLSSSSVNRRIPEALSPSRSKPAGVSDGNWIRHSITWSARTSMAVGNVFAEETLGPYE